MLLVVRQACSTPPPPSTPTASSVSMSIDNSQNGGISPTFSVEITPPVEPIDDENGLPTASSIHITPPLEELDENLEPYNETLIEEQSHTFVNQPSIATQTQTNEDHVTNFFEMVRFFYHKSNAYHIFFYF